jgi:hypothetical protein
MMTILDFLQRTNKDFVTIINLTQSKGGYYNTIVQIQNAIGFLTIGSLCYKYSVENSLEGRI